MKKARYAVIFTSSRTDRDSEGYEKEAKNMIELVHKQKGFVSAQSVRDASGFGITVSYWETLEDIKNWKANREHARAQQYGRSKWYSSYTTQICKIEEEN